MEFKLVGGNRAFGYEVNLYGYIIDSSRKQQNLSEAAKGQGQRRAESVLCHVIGSQKIRRRWH